MLLSSDLHKSGKDFCSRVESLYSAIGKYHIVPFIGECFGRPNEDHFRAAVIGFNSYLSEGDYGQVGADTHFWFRNWWKEAGHGSDTYSYFQRAWREVEVLSEYLSRQSCLDHLKFDLDPRTKRGLYATNAVKEFTPQSFKRSTSVTREYLNSFDPVWRTELALMAQHQCLPHLIVVLGHALWEPHWKSLHPDHASEGSIKVLGYRSAGDMGRLIRHHANRVILQTGAAEHTLLLVRVHHPSARSPRRDARWLISQPEFLDFVGK